MIYNNWSLGVWPKREIGIYFETRSGGLGWVVLRILSTPPHAAGDGTTGWWGGWKGFSFVFQAFVAFRGRSAVPPRRGRWDIWMVGWMEGFFLCFSGVRGVSGAFGRSGRSGCRWGKCFENVGIFRFSRMLDFQMLEFRIFRCWDSRIFGCWAFRIFGTVGFSNVRMLLFWVGWFCENWET